MDPLHYLAYGSNLYPARLRERVASARSVGKTELVGWSLRFHKRGLDGSGKCDIVPTGDATDRVHAAVYAIAADHLPALDRVEDLGRSYRRQTLDIDRFGRVFCYVADSAYVDPGLRPYDWYLAYVLAGALWHGFPTDYCARLRGLSVLPDPDRARATAHRIAIDHPLRLRR